MSTSPGTDSSSPYQTPTRHSGTNYIRLIKLLPGSPESPIACTLHELELEKPGEFTALSYTWGKPDPTFEITLNGRQIQVRENLYSFLKQARELGRSELLWIDVISINQDNIEERNHQVALMGQVYRRAAKVVVWLSPSTLDFEEVMDYLQGNMQISGLLTRFYAVHFLLHPYWHRLWVQQEFIVAKQIEFCYPNKILDTAIVDLLLSACSERNDVAGQQTLHNRNLWHASARQGPEDIVGLDFHTVMSKSLGLHCLDSLDQIYGLLGLVRYDQLAILDITPDYSRDVDSLGAHLLKKIPVLHADNPVKIARCMNAVQRVLGFPQILVNEHW